VALATPPLSKDRYSLLPARAARHACNLVAASIQVSGMAPYLCRPRAGNIVRRMQIRREIDWDKEEASDTRERG
jgi:hypothetical protein